jgi:hypothetical protein
MPRPTPRDPNRPVTAYTTRALYVDLLDRLRVLAAIDNTTIEDALNYVVEMGLDMEGERRAREEGRDAG